MNLKNNLFFIDIKIYTSANYSIACSRNFLIVEIYAVYFLDNIIENGSTYTVLTEALILRGKKATENI